MNRWQPSDVLVLLIVILLILLVIAAIGATYLELPFHEGRSTAMASILDALIAVIAMYLGAKLR